MTPDELLAVYDRDAQPIVYLGDRVARVVTDWAEQAHSDRHALLGEINQMMDARNRIASLAEAEHTMSHAPGTSRAEKVAHKAAAHAYETALSILTEGIHGT